MNKADFEKWCKENNYWRTYPTIKIVNQFAEDFAEKENAELRSILRGAMINTHKQIGMGKANRLSWYIRGEKYFNQKYKDEQS
jgi:hypothetical protein